MVEELIAEGYTVDQVIDIVMTDFGMSRPDARLYVQTSLGEPGDVLEVGVDDAYDRDVETTDLTASVFVEQLHPRHPRGVREGGRFSPKQGTSTALATKQAEQAAEEAQKQDDASPALSEEDRLLIQRDYAKIAERPDLLPVPEGAATVENISRMGIASTNPIYTGLLDGKDVVLKPEMQLSPVRLRTHVEPGYDLEREQAAAHVGAMMRDIAPTVAPNVLSYDVMETSLGRTGVTPFIQGQSLAVRARVDPESVGAAIAPDIRRIRLYDGIIGNTDRHEGNVMIGPGMRVYPIDHGLAFPDENQEGSGNYQAPYMETPLETNEIRALETLYDRIPSDEVLPTLLTDGQIGAMRDRIAFMLYNGRIANAADWEKGFEDDA